MHAVAANQRAEADFFIGGPWPNHVHSLRHIERWAALALAALSSRAGE